MRAGDGHRGVWLDTPRLDRREPGLLEKQLPNLMSRARIAGLDPRTHPLLVHPTLHCQNGGIAIGVNGESSVPGLFAVGDVELCPGSGHYIGGEETAALEWMEGTSPFRKRRNALASSSTPPLTRWQRPLPGSIGGAGRRRAHVAERAMPEAIPPRVRIASRIWSDQNAPLTRTQFR